MKTPLAPHENHRERMRQRFLHSPESFADHELLELLLYHTVPRKDTNALAHKILSYFYSLRAVFEADIDTLLKIDGVGEKTAVFIKTTGMIMARASQEEKFGKPHSAIKNVLDLACDLLSDERNEKFACFFFDEKMRLLKTVSFDSTFRDSVEVCLPALSDALSVIRPKFAVVAHNHPSGNLLPSSADDSTTIKLIALFSLHGTALSDHIIVGRDGKRYSYFLEGRLQHLKERCNIDTMIRTTLKENL